MIDYLTISLFVVIFAGGLIVGVTTCVFMTIQTAAGQTPTTITASNPESGLKFLEQKAYIYTIPPLEVQQQQQQQQPSNGTVESMITAGIGSAIAYFGAKFNADKKHKENAAEILKGKEVNKELARVTYDINPEAAAKIEDAPLIKNETLAADVTQYGATVAKK
jgi:Na+/H+ antiporter NhaC